MGNPAPDLQSHATRQRERAAFDVKGVAFLESTGLGSFAARGRADFGSSCLLDRRRRPTKTMRMTPKNTICLWFDKDAEAAARFYAATFPDSAVTAVHQAPSDFPDGKQGDVLTVEFSVFGVACLGLNGGPAFKQSEAFSFQIATEDQAETDRY
jgi:hypothetical protein